MHDPILFSVVIPTYNRENFILNTLNSVFSQTYPHFEVIIVDNCSTDNTITLLQPLADSGKIRLIQHDKNYERSRSRNTGMENASGEYLTFLDSDDFMYPDNLADAADFIEKNPNLKCFQNLYELINTDGRVIRKYSFPRLDDPIKAIVSGNFMSCIGGFIHREIYNKYRFDTYKALTGAEDWDFWLRVIADYGMARINKINNAILHHSLQTVQSNKHYEELEQGYWYLFKKFAEDDHLRNIYFPYLDRIKANSYMYLATLANTNGNFDDARKYLKIALKNDSKVFFTIRFLSILRRAVTRQRIK